MIDRLIDKRTIAEKHMRNGHTVVIRVVDSNELTICQTCKITLCSKKIGVS